MANFCTKCGNPIYLCTCEDKVKEEPKPQVKRGGSFCTKCGKPLAECQCNSHRDEKISVKNMLGITESDVLKKEDCFEVGKKIVPDLIEPCDGEIPIKQYEVGRVRRRSNFSWGYSRIQVTNKRIIQRTVGRSIIGKDLQYQEFAIDDIAGMNFNRGKQFSIGDFFLWLIASAITGGIGVGLSALFGEDAAVIIGSIIAFLVIGAWIYIRFAQRKSSNVLFALMFSFATGMVSFGLGMDMERILFGFMWDGDASGAIPAFLALVCLIMYIVYLIRSSLLPSISILVKTRVYASEGARVSAGIRVTNFKIGSVILPGADTETALREIGAIVTDVQKLGDYAIEKWQVK